MKQKVLSRKKSDEIFLGEFGECRDIKVEDSFCELLFGFLKLEHSFLNGILHDEPAHLHWPLLTDSIHSIYGLEVDGGVPCVSKMR